MARFRARKVVREVRVRAMRSRLRKWRARAERVMRAGDEDGDEDGASADEVLGSEKYSSSDGA